MNEDYLSFHLSFHIFDKIRMYHTGSLSREVAQEIIENFKSMHEIRFNIGNYFLKNELLKEKIGRDYRHFYFHPNLNLINLHNQFYVNFTFTTKRMEQFTQIFENFNLKGEPVKGQWISNNLYVFEISDVEFKTSEYNYINSSKSEWNVLEEHIENIQKQLKE